MYNAEFVGALKEALKGLRVIHSVGEEWHSYTGEIPVGGVPYCGQTVTRETYSALWSYAQSKGLVISEAEWQIFYTQTNGNVPLYSEGDGSTTFRMPRIVGYVRGASTQDEAGGHFAEGLPNITGDLTNKIAIQNAYTQTLVTGIHGAFGMTEAMGTYGGYGSDDKTVYLDFDASRSNPIYGNSDHVIPETSCVLFGVYAFGELGNVESLDVTTLATAVARLEANIESSVSSKLDDSDKEKIVGWVMPDYNSGVSLAISQDHTITRKGWVLMRNTDYITRLVGYLNGKEVFRQAGESYSFEDWNSLFIPVKEGDVVALHSGGELMFYPAMGVM